MKGQISIDILLALIAAIVFFSVLMVHNDNMVQSTDAAALHSGLKAILADVYAAVGTVKAEGVQVTYISPTLNLGDGGAPLPSCTITITASSISVGAEGQTASYTNITTEVTALPSSFACGSTSTIS